MLSVNEDEQLIIIHRRRIFSKLRNLQILPLLLTDTILTVILSSFPSLISISPPPLSTLYLHFAIISPSLPPTYTIPTFHPLSLPALVNKGNVLYSRGEYEAAREFYQEALSVEATCSEALFNTGLVHKQMRRY